MSRASELREERNDYRSMYNQAMTGIRELTEMRIRAERELEVTQRMNKGLLEDIRNYGQILENMAIIDPSIHRFRDENGDWKAEEIACAAEWIRGHDAVHSFDQHDEPVNPVVFLFGGGDAA